MLRHSFRTLVLALGASVITLVGAAPGEAQTFTAGVRGAVRQADSVIPGVTSS